MKNWSFKSGERPEKNWPAAEDGTPASPAFLMHAEGTQAEADLTVNLLNAYGIPATCVYPNNGEFGKIILGFPASGADIYVPETMLEDAQNIICGDMTDEETEE
jgi:hypothetical protein